MKQLRAVAVLFACAGLCTGAFAGAARAAEKLPPLDAEFLEYLGSFGSDEDWTLFVDEDEDEAAAGPSPAKQPIAKREDSKTEAAATPAAEKR
jgi:hypothetical protein